MNISLDPLAIDESALRRRAHESGAAYRRRAFENLSASCRPYVDAAIAVLNEGHYEFDSIRAIHEVQLRRPLIERHSFPYLLTHHALFPGRPVDVRVLAACLAGHTLALTHLDYHLDGAEPAGHRTVTAVKVAAPSAVSYALRMVYRAGYLASQSPACARLHAEVFEPVSGFVIARMHEDWLTRYDVDAVRRTGQKDCEEYLTSSRSRLLASGYWEVMARAAVIANGAALPGAIIRYCEGLRKLRQLADEAEDLAEDLKSGLLTLPTLIRLAAPDSRALRDGLADAWKDGESTKDLEHLVEELVALVSTQEIGRRISAHADIFGDRACAAAMESTPRPGALEVLLDLKRAKLEDALKAYDISPNPNTFS